MYTRDGSEIDEVFKDQISVREFLQIKSAAAVSKAIATQAKCQGVRLSMWDDVSEELQEKFLEHKSLPQPPEKEGRAVLQLDSKTEDVISRHPNVAFVARTFRMSHGTVVKACNSKEHHAGFLWKWA